MLLVLFVLVSSQAQHWFEFEPRPGAGVAVNGMDINLLPSVFVSVSTRSCDDSFRVAGNDLVAYHSLASGQKDVLGSPRFSRRLNVSSRLAHSGNQSTPTGVVHAVILVNMCSLWPFQCTYLSFCSDLTPSSVHALHPSPFYEFWFISNENAQKFEQSPYKVVHKKSTRLQFHTHISTICGNDASNAYDHAVYLAFSKYLPAFGGHCTHGIASRNDLNTTLLMDGRVAFTWGV
jgi:hypothetical protein